MDPTLIAGAVKAGFEFGTELLQFLQTEQGKQLVAKSMEDRTKWDAFWKQVGDGVRGVFSGEALGWKPRAD